MNYKNEATEILEEFASSYSEVDRNRLARKLEDIAKEAQTPPSNAKYGELLRLVAENPSLPVVPMVYSEVVQDEGYAWWLGSFGEVSVDEYVIFKSSKYDDGKYYTKGDEDEIEEIIAEWVSEENPQMSESEIFAEAHRQAEALPWKKAILVYIGLPEVDDE